MKPILVASFILALAAASSSAATFTVTNTDDSGAGSLRQAILDANANPGTDTIAFNIPGAGVHTITPSTPLDFLTDPVVIDGYTQPGSSENTDPIGTNAVLLIELDGAVANGPFVIGLNLTKPGNTVQGLVLNDWAHAIQTFDTGGGGGNVIRGNYIGTDPTGTFAKPNGVAMLFNAPNDLFGGTAPGDRNLVSGNTENLGGAAIENNVTATIRGNLIGTDASGMHAIPNANAVLAGPSLVLGGSAPGAGNVISGNTEEGVLGGLNAVIQGNLIGVAADGSTPLGNGKHGIDLHEVTGATIGGLGAGEANIIANNRLAGVNLSTSDSADTVRGNSIYGNGIGIDLSENGPSHNDPADADEGANHLQNFPIVRSVTNGAATHVVVKFNSAPSTTYDLDWYVNPACSRFPRELHQGETYMTSTQVTTDGSGHADIDTDLPFATQAGERVAVTATDPSGNTSEFSQRIIFSMDLSSGPPAGGFTNRIHGTDFSDPTTGTVGGVAVPLTFVDDHTLDYTVPGLAPGTVNDVVVITADGTTGTLVNGWVADFLDVNSSHQFYSFVTTLVSNAITVGVGGGVYGVDQPTLRRQMAVFLMKAKHGLCYTPPPCTTQIFTDVPCSSGFSPWINELVAEGITGGCGDGTTFCPTDPVKRQQMAVLLIRTLEGAAYAPPACVTATFTDMPCDSPFAPWVYDLVDRNITGGCGGGLYCPTVAATRGQMAVFVDKTFSLQ